MSKMTDTDLDRLEWWADGYFTECAHRAVVRTRDYIAEIEDEIKVVTEERIEAEQRANEYFRRIVKMKTLIAKLQGV